MRLRSPADHFNADGTIRPERFIVMVSTAQMSSRYRMCSKRAYRTAIVETDGVALPKMISARAKHLVRIVVDYGVAVHHSRSEMSPHKKNHAEAIAHAETLNQNYRFDLLKEEDANVDHD